MYGYQVLLQSPNRANQVMLRVISARRYQSVISLLQGESLWGAYSDWTMLSFQTAFTPSNRSKPVMLDQQIAEPGSAISVVV